MDKLCCSANLLVFYLKIWVIVTNVGDFKVHRYSDKVKLDIFSKKWESINYCYNYFNKSVGARFRILFFH